MLFAANDEQHLLADSVGRLLSEANEFEHRRKRLRAEHPDRLALWPQLAEMGVLGAAFGEAHGGFAGDARTIAVVMAELGRALAVEPYLATTVIAGRILQRWSDDAARSALLESLIAGEALWVLAHDAGDNPYAAPLLKVALKNGVYAFEGVVRHVRHADVAQTFLITARVDGELAIFAVPRDSAGLTIEAYRLIDAAGGGDLHLRGLRLPASARLRFTTSAQAALHDAIDWGLLGLAAETAGIVDALNKATFAYLMTRKQFGTAIGNFQALQHRAADMYIANEELLSATESAIEALGNSPSPSRSASLAVAKVVADVSGRRVGAESVQMHGGMGVSDELNVSHYHRRLVAIRAELGSADLHRLRFGGLL